MGKSKIRKPAVAGQFYPLSSQELKNQVEKLVDKKADKLDAIACILPHAGYMYSGKVAAETVSRINIKDRIILLGPNHSGYGTAFSIMTEGIWQTPLGAINIDSDLAKQILGRSKYLEDDTLAHMYEHSLEVELPFLQYFRKDFEIVPITFLSDDLDILKEIGKDIALTIKESNLKNSTLLIASSDMTHYESRSQAQKKDEEAINAILELNEDRLLERVGRLGISMCGYAPVITVIAAAKLLGAKAAKLIKYQTSGDVTGDQDSVVGYAGIVIH
jgi:AmmeMemoRadiSam system protein B